MLFSILHFGSHSGGLVDILPHLFVGIFRLSQCKKKSFIYYRSRLVSKSLGYCITLNRFRPIFFLLYFYTLKITVVYILVISPRLFLPLVSLSLVVAKVVLCTSFSYQQEFEWQQVSSNLTNSVILVDLNNAEVWRILAHPSISDKSSPLTKHLSTIPSAAIILGITVTFMFNSFFNWLARSKKWFLFCFLWFSFWSAKTVKSSIRQVLFNVSESYSSFFST